jgi:diguanylate cyclase (GGDEF)-like protein
LKDRVTQALANAKRKRHSVGLLFLDIDHFKSINDSMGHDVGDGLIVSFAERVKGSLRESDTLCRLGGDEFVVLLPSISSIDDVAASAERIIRTLQLPWDIHGYSFTTTSSIGGAVSMDSDTVDNLMKKADKALYEAKEQGRNTFRVFKT